MKRKPEVADVVIVGSNLSCLVLAVKLANLGLKVTLLSDNQSELFKLNKSNENLYVRLFGMNNTSLVSYLFEDAKFLLDVLNKEILHRSNEFSVLGKNLLFNYSNEENCSIYELITTQLLDLEKIKKIKIDERLKINSDLLEYLISKTKVRSLNGKNNLFEGVSEEDLKRIRLLLSSLIQVSSRSVKSYLADEILLNAIPLNLTSVDIFNQRIITEIIIEKIKTIKNIKFYHSNRISGLERSGDFISGVLTDDYLGLIEGKHVVLGDNVLKLFKPLKEFSKDESFSRSLDLIEPQLWRVSLDLEVKTSSLPNEFKSRAILSFNDEESRRFGFSDLAEVIRIGKINSSDERLLFTFWIPYSPGSISKRSLKVEIAKSLQQLKETFPFIEINNANSLIDESFVRYKLEVLLQSEMAIGLDYLTHYYVRGERERQSFWGVGWSTPFKNLYFSSPISWPSLGETGALLAGRYIYEQIKEIYL